MRSTLLIATVLFATLTGRAAAVEPNVVTSIKPVHGLVAAVMEGVGTPHLILDGGGSPHGFALKPSDAAAMAEADLVFWIGPGLERFMVKPLETLASEARSVPLMEAKGVALLDYRDGGAWGEHDHDHSHGTGHDHGAGHDHGTGHGHGAGHDHQAKRADPHIWLDPKNAQAMLAEIAEALSRIDPDNAPRYRENVVQIRAALTTLEVELDDTLSAVRERPYLVFHDGFHYLEHRYRLSGVGAVAVNPEVAPGAARLVEIRELMRETGAVCVFSEPQFKPRILDIVTEGSKARTGVLDPMGADLPSGPNFYAALMRRNAEAMRACLSPD